MGVLFIKSYGCYYVKTGGLKQVFRTLKILLGKIFIPRKTEPLFETGGNSSAKLAVKCLGTRCESGTVAPL
jgi:hypothetical protein